MMMTSNSIYTNIYEVVANSDYFIYFFIGGRGIGKTFGFLYNAFLNKETIMYMRTTETILKGCCNALGNPYKDINVKKGTNISMKMNHDIGMITDDNTDQLIGYGHGLTTFANVKGTGFPDVTMIYYDEFVEKSEQHKKQANMLFESIETINRNRELDGSPPIKVVLTSNSTSLNCPILRTLGLIEPLTRIKQDEGAGVYIDKERGIYAELLENKKVQEAKQQTALYKLTKGTAFYDMALSNEFVNDYFGDVNFTNYKELFPLCSFEGLYFYKHKSKDLLYVSTRKAQCKSYNLNNLVKFMRDYGYMLRKYQDFGLMIYQNYAVKMDTYDILK